jgi:ribosomal protein S18 acetylase RimI-like enzyme
MRRPVVTESVHYRLVPAVADDQPWLDHLRRSVYRELFIATFGDWDEERHVRHTSECWNRGHISIIEVDGVRVGMVQLFDEPDSVEVGEIQIQPSHQSRGIGGRVLSDTVEQAHKRGKGVKLSVALKNERAYHFYQRLGFRHVAQTETHNLLSCEPQND